MITLNYNHHVVDLVLQTVVIVLLDHPAWTVYKVKDTTKVI